MRIHIVNPFGNAYGGSEWRALALYDELRKHAEAILWAQGIPHHGFTSRPIRRIGAGEERQPRGGVLVVVGPYFGFGDWLEQSDPDRIVLIYNTYFPDVESKLRAWNALRRLRDPELVYASRKVAEWVGLPGVVQASLIDTGDFTPRTGVRSGPFVVGRLSRDVRAKHHPQDAGLYRRLAQDGVRIRIMGGRCLDAQLAGVPGIELLAAGVEPAPRFLRSLDCFLYRTSLDWTEPSGRVVSEAMSCGLPVVCERRGGYVEWIEHGRNGFLFDTDVEAVEILRMLRNDAALCSRIGDAARQGIEQMVSPSVRRGIVQFYLANPGTGAEPAARAGEDPPDGPDSREDGVCLPDASLAHPPGTDRRPRGRRVVFAWELGGHTGHFTTLLPIARRMQSSGHDVCFLLRELQSGADLDGAAGIPRRAAPIWVGPMAYANPLNFGEILHNFGYQHPDSLRQLVDAWRAELRGTHLVVANVAPVAHIAARTLGIPSFEISQGFHIPPATMPAPPLRDWEPAPRAQLEAADRRVLEAINSVLLAYGAAPIGTIGELFADRAMLLTYPELDIYPERGPADYYGIPYSGEGNAVPHWPQGTGARVFSYLYNYCPGFDALLSALESLQMPTLLFCRGMDGALKERHSGGSVRVMDEPMAVSRLLGEADMVLCHGSHQMTAQALLAGKPVLTVPTQLEQFLITRRVVRFGAGLGIAPGAPDPDFAGALAELAGNPKYGARAREFARLYAGHDRAAAIATMIARCEAAMRHPAADAGEER